MTIHPAELMAGTTIEIQCSGSQLRWPPLETLHLECGVCGSCATRTGRIRLSQKAGRELCGTCSSPRLRGSVDTSETYTLHLDIPEIGKFKLE